MLLEQPLRPDNPSTMLVLCFVLLCTVGFHSRFGADKIKVRFHLFSHRSIKFTESLKARFDDRGLGFKMALRGTLCIVFIGLISHTAIMPCLKKTEQ